MPSIKYRGILEMNSSFSCKSRLWTIVFSLVFMPFLSLDTVIGQSPADDQIKLKAAENAMVGYDHSNHFKKKLLEFVTPVYNQPLLHSGLISSLAAPKEGASYKAIAAADDIAALGADSMRLEQQGRLVERSIQLKMLKDQGMPAPGLTNTIRAGKLAAKVLELKGKEDLWTESVKAMKTRNSTKMEMHLERMKDRMEQASIKEIGPGLAKNAAYQNFLLENMRTNLLTYGSSLGDNPNYQEVLEKLVLPEEDFDKILLEFDDQGREFVFVATKGARDLGKPPLIMRHPEITPVLSKCESMFENLGNLDQESELYEATFKLSDALHSLDEVCDKVIGTRRECAARDSQSFRMWQKGQDYRNRLRGLLNRIQLVGDTAILGTSQDRYDPKKRGCGVLAFAKFVADSGCKFAPATPGNEVAYVRLYAGLLQLQAIIGE